MRLVFAGTPDFALPSLDRLALEHDVVAVLTRPARPVGRGRKVQETAVAVRARERGIPVHDPERPSGPEFLEELRRIAPDLVVVVSFGKILSDAFLAVPRSGCVNLHFSLLPEYRGASPVQAALAQGKRETGVTVFRLVRRMDAGPVLGVRRVGIEPGENAGSLLARLGGTGADLLSETLRRIEAGEMVEVPQDESRATYCHILRKEDGRIEWARPAAEIVDRARAMTPWPGAFTWLVGQDSRVVVTLAVSLDPERETGAEPGRVLAASPEGIDVAAGRGVVRVLSIQPSGKRAMSAADFLRGRTLTGDDRFGTPEREA